MRRRGARAFGLVVVGAFFFGAGARAQPVPEPGPRVDAGPRVDVNHCPDDLTARLPSVVKLEIDVLLRERGPTRAPPQSIAVRCEEDRAHIEVTVEGASRASTIDLRVLAAEHRARAVALATAELVHSMSSPPAEPLENTRRGEAASEHPKGWTSQGRPTATLSSSPEQPIRPAPDGSAQRTTRPALLVGGLAEWLGKPAALLFGARVAFHYPLGKVVVQSLSVDGSLGGTTSQSAEVAAKTLSAAAHLYFGTTTGHVRWEAGPGARIGWVHLIGQPDAQSGLEGRTLTAAWGGPELRARVTYSAPRRSPLLALELGGGFVTLPVRGLIDGTARVYAVEGTWMSVCAEVGFGP